jgi:hypothetical protein
MPDFSRIKAIQLSYLYLPASIHYGDYEITVEIETGVVRGEFPKRALRAVLEWADIHQDKLMLDWELAEQRKPLLPISPLE